ncbi:MAG: hypothetical protein PHV62_03365 [Sulfuricurvum sp.]|nr:hypothetical protein [Sulfuricurvum sp.]
MNHRIDPQNTVQSLQIKEIEKIFNRFRSGSETLADALQMTPQEYDALIHGESSLSIEQIDRLVDLGVDLGSLFDTSKKVVL